MALKQTTQPQAKPKRKRFLSLRVLIVTIILGSLMPLAYVGWRELYARVLEATPPELVVTAQPRGIGLLPVSLSFEIGDQNSGLYEVVVRARQRNKVTQLLRKKLNGSSHEKFDLALPGQNGGVEEGHPVTLELRAFDSAFWMNSAERDIVLPVDFRKPKVEVLSTQHNARQGGSQIVFYRVFDEETAISGVKVGSRTFQGFPARGIDPELEDDSLFVVIYAIDLALERENPVLKAFAEDRVGNAASQSFYNKVAPRTARSINVKLRDDFLRSAVSGLADAKVQELVSAPKQGPVKPIVFKGAPGSKELLLDKFRFVNDQLRRANDDELVSRLKGPRHDRYWEGAFMTPRWTVLSGFGNRVSYIFEGENIAQSLQRGFEFLVTSGDKEVYAANDGIVIFSDYVGTYGRVVAIDHGLGLSSIYAHLESSSVGQGERVGRGQSIGVAGKTGFAQELGFYFEMRVQGVAVDPSEWWDNDWFGAHVIEKINDIKRSLGIQVYRLVK